HDYIDRAHEQGAVAALVSETTAADLPAVKVANTRIALGTLAASWRSDFDLPVVAVTGSNGKTTVKEMLSCIFSQACDGNSEQVLSTIGNLKHDLGLPLTLLRLRKNHRYAVTEMGMNHAGELTYLSSIARPDVAVITNAAAAHLEGLQTIEGVARAKAEIFSGVKAGGTAVINGDDEFASLWRELAGDLQLVSFSMNHDAEVRAEFDLYKDHSRILFHTPWGDAKAQLALPGKHNVANALAAVAAAGSIGVRLADIVTGLEAWQGVKGRLQSRTINGLQIIDDSYNANPASIRAALEVLAMQIGMKIFVMGDMGELGEDSAALHRQAGEMAEQMGIDACYTLGKKTVLTAQRFGSHAQSFNDVNQLVSALLKELRANRDRPINILVKGSRAMKMEQVIELLDKNGTRN
ncbi:MAG: UDP-N-acetylmuramoyl-tripeptide--D-alanyl-D-alanine ligase, partial [Gammaproteobacteria bacterium]|nr:UDP-N-acetylmuramoyl-tripeptide--D-alanyl-D-alanine ligase [Gammaproteobacteria bacterium]